MEFKLTPIEKIPKQYPKIKRNNFWIDAIRFMKEIEDNVR
jgi:hypothetical protein